MSQMEREELLRKIFGLPEAEQNIIFGAVHMAVMLSEIKKAAA